MAANLEDADCVPFVQLGYGEIQGGQPLTWLWTNRDDTCGVIVQGSGGCGPLVGHNVRFIIDKPNGIQWRYHISDLTSGCGLYSAIDDHGEYTSRVWFGIEMNNDGDQFGGQSLNAKASITNMTYQFIGDGTSTPTQVLGTDNTGWANAGVIPWYWDESVTGGGGPPTLSGWTASH